ncbi:hypothetical protein WIW50_01135 [Flavobacteriaceae bacterium 3-367]|uniref:hypothetical protein n=1 Tax=Eudoraea algarum TaxID=3417568 RepID=UPI0032744C0D
MAPTKFEEQIKEKLNERRMQPTERAWEAISETLYTNRASKRGNFFWYGLAASFAGILAVSLWYFSLREVSTAPDQQTVEVPVSKKKIEQPKGNNTIPALEKVPEEIAVAKEDTEVMTEEAPLAKNAMAQRETDIKVTEKIHGSELIRKKEWSESQEIIDTKIAEVIAQVDLLEQENTVVTDAELETLLRKAQEEILAERIFREDQTVDASALLAEAESELDKSFRDQIFETLKKGYFKVRTAVADRNN